MKTLIPESWDIPLQIRERFGDSAGRQRSMFAGGHLLLVLHQLPAHNNRNRQARILWRAPSGEWAWTTNVSTNDLLKKHIAGFAERAEMLEAELQGAICAADYFKLLQSIGPLHRTSRNLHAALQQAREMVPDDREIIAARDAAGEVERAFELLHQDAKNGLEFTAAEKAEIQSDKAYEMAVSAHRLNILAALFFPITAISSIFGMNFHSGLETIPGSWMFWGILGGGFVSGVLLMQVIKQSPSAAQSNKRKGGKALRKKLEKPQSKQLKPVKGKALKGKAITQIKADAPQFSASYSAYGFD